MGVNGTVVGVIGGGFAGAGCAKRLADDRGITVELFDGDGFHQFQPLLYQVATAELAVRDVRFDLARIFRDTANVNVRKARAVNAEPRRIELEGGESVPVDYVVLAAGATANFFHTPGAEEHTYPLYSVEDAKRLRDRLLTAFDDVSHGLSLLDKGALDFVVVGGGPTGVEIAGALADLIRDVMPHVHRDIPAGRARVILVDLGQNLLSGFSQEAGSYAAQQLQRRGVQLRLGVAVKAVFEDRVELADGSVIPTRLCVWGGGLEAAGIAATSGLPRGRGGRIDVLPDLTIPGYPNMFAVGDIANIPHGDGTFLPQLGSVAQQAGRWAAGNIIASVRGEALKPFHYRDKGIMAMIGRKAAVAEIGPHRHELNGRLAFAAWLGVHAELLGNIGVELNAFVAWAEEFYFRPHHRSAELLTPSQVDTPRIDWDQKG